MRSFSPGGNVGGRSCKPNGCGRPCLWSGNGRKPKLDLRWPSLDNPISGADETIAGWRQCGVGGCRKKPWQQPQRQQHQQHGRRSWNGGGEGGGSCMTDRFVEIKMFNVFDFANSKCYCFDVQKFALHMTSLGWKCWKKNCWECKEKKRDNGHINQIDGWRPRLAFISLTLRGGYNTTVYAFESTFACHSFLQCLDAVDILNNLPPSFPPPSSLIQGTTILPNSTPPRILQECAIAASASLAPPC